MIAVRYRCINYSYSTPCIMHANVQHARSHLRFQHVRPPTKPRLCTLRKLATSQIISMLRPVSTSNNLILNANRSQEDGAELSIDEQRVVQVYASALGVSVEQFVDLACECPHILDISPTALRSTVGRLSALLGKPQQDITAWILSAPATTLQQQPEDLDNHISDISDATGMYYSQVVDVVMVLPQVLDMPASRLAGQISSVAMIARASREQAVKMVLQRPELLTADTQQLKALLIGGGTNA